jgi:hypothetical protein
MVRFSSLRFIGLILILIALTLAIQVPIARTAGTVATCDETNFDSALGGGGLVNFSCSGTILITTQKLISVDTTIDGSGQSITLDGADFVQLFNVNAGVTLQLNNLTLTNGNGSAMGGGGVVLNHGTTIITNSTLTSNFSGGGQSGGAISNAGMMTIVNSTFSGNTAFVAGGGAIVNAGVLNITDSTFTNNASALGGAVANASNGTTNITNSIFTNNSANSGGAVYNAGMGTVTTTIVNSTFVDNTAIEGGALYNLNILTTSGSTYVNNTCVGTIGDGGTNHAINASGCPGTPDFPAPDQCQETLDPAYAAPVGWYCQVLMRNNAWVGYPGTIPSELTDAGVIIAVDVIYYDYPGHAAQEVDGVYQVCLQGEGRFIFLSNAQSPRVIVEMNSVYEGGYTCAWIDTPGTAVLIHG